MTTARNHLVRTGAFLLLCLLAPCIQAQDVVINELVASNSSGITDEDGEHPDWVELYNPGDESADLSGYGLSDDPDDPFKWMIEGLTLAPGARALLFASGKDRPGFDGHWESVVGLGEAGRFLADAQPPVTWTSPGFDDAAWTSGSATATATTRRSCPEAP